MDGGMGLQMEGWIYRWMDEFTGGSVYGLWMN